MARCVLLLSQHLLLLLLHVIPSLVTLSEWLVSLFKVFA
jgi:hypothetical protein